jgi:hypothetical protein
MTGRATGTGIALRIICALALLFLGLSHKMPVAAAQPDSLAFLQAYSLPDGSAPDLCTPSDAGRVKFAAPDCDACRLSGSVLLPEPPQIAAVAFDRSANTFPLPVQAAIASAIARSQTARGPPSSALS